MIVGLTYKNHILNSDMQNNLFLSYRNVSVEYGGVVCVSMCVARVCM